jgi:hypothetical protein
VSTKKARGHPPFEALVTNQFRRRAFLVT